jgi:hypothetical protein
MVLVNSYLLSSYANEKGGRGVGQKAFQKKLISQLFELGRAKAQKQARVISHTNPLLFAVPEQHVLAYRKRDKDCCGYSFVEQI